MNRLITLRVNGQSSEVSVRTDQTLLDVLRSELKYFSVREACGIGMCGSCTVLADGKPVSSCLLLACLAVGKEISTVESLATENGVGPLQQAFVDHGAFQCSYCTPGFLLCATALLREVPRPTAEEVRAYLAGNLCRCGSYLKIQDAVLAVAERVTEPSASLPAATEAIADAG